MIYCIKMNHYIYLLLVSKYIKKQNLVLRRSY